MPESWNKHNCCNHNASLLELQKLFTVEKLMTLMNVSSYELKTYFAGEETRAARITTTTSTTKRQILVSPAYLYLY